MGGFLPTVVSIDVEPDRRPSSRTDRTPWEGWTRAIEVFVAARERFARATRAPVHWSWFLRTDPQIQTVWGSGGFALESERARVDALVAEGDEVGVHCHAFRWDGTDGRWVSDHGDPAHVARCVDGSLDAFERATGRPCRSFRFGARWIDEATVRRLASRGVQFDLTLEPGYPRFVSEPGPDEHLGEWPDFRRAPRGVYRPGPDFLSPSRHPERSDGPWMIPMSTASPERRLRALARPLRDLLRRGPRPPRPWASLLLTEKPRAFRRVLDRVLADRSTRHLSVIVRSDGALGPSRRVVEENLEAVASRAAPRTLRVVRPDEAVAALSAKGLSGASFVRANGFAP